MIGFSSSLNGSVAATVPASVTTAITVAGFKGEALSAVGGLTDHFRFSDAATNSREGDQSGHGRASDENREPEEYFAHNFASSPNVSFEGTLR